VRWQIAQRGIGFESQVHDSTANLGTTATLAKEERFLHCADRHLRRSEGERKASVRFGRNDEFCGGADDKFAEVLRQVRGDVEELAVRPIGDCGRRR
jgi:hypothetical protein